MSILGKIASKQRGFCIGGREVLRVDADWPTGDTFAAGHFFRMIKALHLYAERELFPSAADALKQAVSIGQGHRFVRWQYRITLSEVPKGKQCFVTLGITLSGADAREGVLQNDSLETAWDKSGAFQSGVGTGAFRKKRSKRNESMPRSLHE